MYEPNPMKTLVAPIAMVAVLAIAVPIGISQILVEGERDKNKKLDEELSDTTVREVAEKKNQEAYRADKAQRDRLLVKLEAIEGLMLPAVDADALRLVSELIDEIRTKKKQLEGTAAVYEMDIRTSEIREFGDRRMIQMRISLTAPSSVAAQLALVIEAREPASGNKRVLPSFLAQPYHLNARGALEGRGDFHSWELEYYFPLANPVDRSDPAPPKPATSPAKKGGSV